MRRLIIILGLLGVAVALAATLGRERAEVAANWLRVRIKGGYTLSERLAQFEPAALPRLVDRFRSAGAAYPPDAAVLLALKDSRVLELHARHEGRWRLVHRYPVLGASGGPGPKLREGDNQVPEGVYRVQSLNPNSLFHVALRLDYPNAFDLRMAAADGRQSLGGDIMIHGKSSSIGCLAMGDEAAEELFVLAAHVGPARLKVLIAPVDLRAAVAPPTGGGGPAWRAELYALLAAQMRDLKSE